MRGTAIFSANRGYALWSSRKLLIGEMIEKGWRVVLATEDDAESRQLMELGAHLEPISFQRGGLNVAGDIGAWRRMYKVYRKWRPDLAQHFHAKPVIAGTLAARRALGGSVRIVNTITGLGHAFTKGGGMAHIAGLGYRAAALRADLTIFQNPDDQDLFIERRWVSKGGARLIAGSGVDLLYFSAVDRRDRDQSRPVVVMLARLLRQKGIPEFVEVSKKVRERFPSARFLLAGEEDPVHPDAVSTQWVHEQAGIEFLGRLADVTPVLAQADLLLFPSYYREGVPRVVMEAAAAGLPTVAFDVPGVREAVRDGETGFLVPERDVESLSKKVLALLEDKERRLSMGAAARSLAEKAFDINTVKEEYLYLYRELDLAI